MSLEIMIAILLYSLMMFGTAVVASIVLNLDYDKALLYVVAGTVVSVWARLIVGGAI